MSIAGVAINGFSTFRENRESYVLYRQVMANQQHSRGRAPVSPLRRSDILGATRSTERQRAS